MLTKTMDVKANARRTKHQRSLARFVRVLRARLPALRERYGVTSLGVFGSYVRGQQKPRSDLDVLVDGEAGSFHRDSELERYLSDTLGVKVDLAPEKNLKPYIGTHIRAEVIWLLRNGQETRAKIPRANGKRNGKMKKPKREYLDYLNDILMNMEMAVKFSSGVANERELYDLPEKVYALSKALENIGEGVKKVPAVLKNNYPQVAWAELADFRNRLVHEYFEIDYEKLWTIVTEDIPRGIPFVKEMVEQEVAARRMQESVEVNGTE